MKHFWKIASLGSLLLPASGYAEMSSALIVKRTALFRILGAANLKAEAKPFHCDSLNQLFKVIRDEKPPVSCPKANEFYAHLLQLEKELHSSCKGTKAIELLDRNNADDDLYLAMDDGSEKDSHRLECEIPLSLGFQLRYDLRKIFRKQ